MLAQRADAAFTSKDWIFEVKWDGIRAISYVNDELSIKSRSGKELLDEFPELRELKSLAQNVVLDGEIVVIRGGRADFQALLERSRTASQLEAEYNAEENPVTYVVFDILERAGKSLVDLPLIERKKVLKETLSEGRYVVLSLFVEEEGAAYNEAALKKGLEGIIAKRKDSPYEVGRRSWNWLKIKTILSCDCAIFGYTEGGGVRGKSFGALLLGLYSEGRPVYVGKVGTGFSEKEIERLMKVFRDLTTEEKTLQNVDIPQKEIIWLRPELVCEVMYQNVTKDGKLRMPRFRNLRLDKTPKECTVDQITPTTLKEYAAKRDFTVTSEPRGREEGALQKEEVDEGGERGERIFVVQEHHARRLHYDLRLERRGVLKSWAVPKGLPEPGDKRLAVETEDHPIGYSEFQGTIPQGEYGAGTVKIWDKGSYEPLKWEDDKIEFILKGERVTGRYVLTRLKKVGAKNWLLLKAKDR